MVEEIKYEDKLRNYTISELEDVERSIDREKYPERFEMILKEKEFRKNNPSYIIAEEPKPDSIFSPNWNRNVVIDDFSPRLYSKRVIYVFCVLFAVVFGGVLFIRNLRTLHIEKPVKIIRAYIILYTAFTIIVVSSFPTVRFGLLFNILGAIPFYSFFWKKYIGDDLKYQKKSYTKPLLISLLIISPFIITIFL